MKKRRFVKLLLFIMLIAGGSVLSAQTPSDGQNPSGGGGAEYSELYKITVAEDIRGSDFYELTAWCRRLGLSEDGSAADLKSRLYEHYGVQAPEEAVKTDGNIITIESADNLEYFDIEKIDENYVEITGRVLLTMEDQDNGDVHRIKADKIIFNFKEEYLTATGNIEYILDSDEKTENFSGEKITFNVSTWEGTFKDGISREEKEIDKENITFLFKGELITKTEDNFVILSKGEVTACDEDDAHFKLRADKIWLLSGDDWALLNGVLYIGRIPILYIPAFLYAGDELAINPVFGYRNDFGYFLQTTTYMVGKREKDDSSFSFLQSSDQSDFLKLNGLYLTADEEPSEEARDFASNFSDSDYLKLILDYYSTLGIYGAVDSNIKKLGIFEDNKLKLGVAKTRKIAKSGSNYVNLFPDSNNQYRSIWQSGYFMNLKLPFRYGLSMETDIDLGWLNVDLALENYSDNFFKSNFNTRSENLDLLAFLDQKTTTTDTSKVKETKWNLTAVLNPDVDILKPWVNKMSITSFKVDVLWQGKAIDTASLAKPDDWQDVLPYFFYPQEIVFPSIDAVISGKILPLPDADSGGDDGNDDGEKEELELRPPWEAHEEGEDPRAPNAAMLPELRPDINIEGADAGSGGNDSTVSLDYELKPGFSQKTQFQSSSWKAPDQIDLSQIEFSLQSANLAGKLNFSADLFDDIISIDNNIKFDAKYQKHYQMDNLSQADQDNFLLQDKQYTQLDLKNDFSLKLMPLKYFTPMSDAAITYSLKNNIFSYDYSTTASNFLTRFMQFEKSDVSEHKLSVNIPLTLTSYKQTLTINANLPPVAASYDGTLKIEAGDFSSTGVSLKLAETNGALVWDPVTFSEKISFTDSSYINSNISYNFNSWRFEKTISDAQMKFLDDNMTVKSKFIYDFLTGDISELSGSLTFYFMSLTLNSLYTDNYDFNQSSGWVQAGTKSFQFNNVNLNADYKSEDFKFWKNRIGMNFAVSGGLNMNMIKFTESSLSFNLSADIKISEFLTLTLKTASENKAIYRYIPAWASAVGTTTLDIFTDLLKSFNFFNAQDRYDSNFNLKSISFGLTHDLHDWDLTVDYTGKPYLNETLAVPAYEWENKLSIFLKWKAVKDIKSEIKIDKGAVSF